DGYVVEDGVVFRHSDDEFVLTCALPNLAYLTALIGHNRVEIEDVSDAYAAFALQGPRAKVILAALAPEIEDLGYFQLTPAKVAGVPVTISRTGFTGDLGYEVWIPSDEALAVWDAVMEEGAGHGLIPFGQIALSMARIEAGLLLIDVDFSSSRFAWTQAQKTTPMELGLGWMVKNLDRAFIGRDGIRRHLEDETARYYLGGLIVDWQDWDGAFDSAG